MDDGQQRDREERNGAEYDNNEKAVGDPGRVRRRAHSMDQSTPETARRVLLAHGVPPALVDLATAPGSPFRLLSWGNPDFQRASELESLVPALAGICPLAEEDGEAVVGLLPASDRFVRYSYEDRPLGDAAI